MVTNQAAKPGQSLLLTKALGTGILFQAMKRELRTQKETRALVASMTHTNQAARDAMVAAGIRAGTDVTGFGLAGHALTLARGSDVDLVLFADRLPALPGVSGYLAQGIYPGTVNANLKGYGRSLIRGPGVPESAVWLAADPQTSGGILMAVPPRRVEALRRALGAFEIGEVRPKKGAKPAVRLESP